jgi:hypothetical protein
LEVDGWLVGDESGGGLMTHPNKQNRTGFRLNDETNVARAHRFGAMRDFPAAIQLNRLEERVF